MGVTRFIVSLMWRARVVGAALEDVLLSLVVLYLVTGDMVLGRLVRCWVDVNTSIATARLCVFPAYSNYLYPHSRADLTAIASATRLMLRKRRLTRWPGGEHSLTGQRSAERRPEERRSFPLQKTFSWVCTPLKSRSCFEGGRGVDCREAIPWASEKGEKGGRGGNDFSALYS